MLTIAALGGGAVLITACKGEEGPDMCCCVTTNNMRSCYSVSGQQECSNGIVEACGPMMPMGFDVRSVPSDGGMDGGGGTSGGQ